METIYLNIAQIILSIVLTVFLLLQLRSGDAGDMFGGSNMAIQRTRRGLEKQLFLVTIVLCIVFFVVTIVNVILTASAGVN